MLTVSSEAQTEHVAFTVDIVAITSWRTRMQDLEVVLSLGSDLVVEVPPFVNTVCGTLTPEIETVPFVVSDDLNSDDCGGTVLLHAADATLKGIHDISISCASNGETRAIKLSVDIVDPCALVSVSAGEPIEPQKYKVGSEPLQVAWPDFTQNELDQCNPILYSISWTASDVQLNSDWFTALPLE